MNPFWWLMAGLGCCCLALVAMIAVIAMDNLPHWVIAAAFCAVVASMVCALVAVLLTSREELAS